MIPIEEFTIGLKNGQIKYTPSPNIKNWLRPQSLDILTGLRLPKTKNQNIIQKLFPTEDVISITQLKRETDGYGRSSVNNHTIIIRISDYLTAYPPLELVKHRFEQESEEHG